MAARSFSTNPTSYDVSIVVIKSRRLAAANSKWKVYLDHLVDSQGNEVLDYMAIEGSHLRQDKIAGVAVLPVVNGRFALIKSYRHALGSKLWEVPHGFIDAGEAPVDAAVRELAEETGLSCAANDLVPLGVYAPEPSTIAARGALFAAVNCSGTPRLCNDEMGHHSLRLFKPAEMADLMKSGEIEDAATLIAYYRYNALAKSTAD